MCATTFRQHPHIRACVELFLLMGSLHVCASAQTATLVGLVSDARSGDRLPGAHIIVSLPGTTEAEIRTSATGDGRFELRHLTPGTYMVVVSYVGYAKRVIAELALAGAETTSVTIALVPEELPLDPVTITASRRPEKALDAPAAVSVLLANDVEAQPTLSVSDHLASVPGVDVAQTGLGTSNMVIRGFNNVSSQALLSLTDNRIAQVPSLRLNYYQFFPVTDDDIERIEVVSGPGSALYGPNSASGVMHIITKSPFGSEGTKVNIGGGERDLVMGSFRHAASSNNVGYKISGQYYKGHDWTATDPAEPASVVKGRQTSTGRINEGAPVPNARDLFVEKLAGDARVDVRFGDEATAVLAAGVNRSNNIVAAEIGSAQLRNWVTYYVQGRLTYGDLFAQAYINGSDAGETYILRTGDRIVDRSTMIVGQVQHGFSLGEVQRFTYGLDILFTQPETGNTINGRNEDDDNTTETGMYLQSETNLFSHVTFVGALRFDDHSRTKDQVFSPRAALVYKPDPSHTLRATYNRAFSSPPNNSLFVDILASSVPAPAGLAPVIGGTLFNIRARGTTPPGFSFSVDSDGRPQMVSLYGGMLAQLHAVPSSHSYLRADVNSVWPALRQLAIASAPQGDQARLDAVLPQQLGVTVPGSFMSLNLGTGGFDPVSTVRDAPVITPTITTTFELGYKGVIDEKILVTADLYHSTVRDFITPLAVETPNVFIDPTTFVPALVNDMVARGFPRDSATATANGIVGSLGQLPIGVISPKEVQNATDIVLTYRNFGDVSLDGIDLGLTYYFTPQWIFGGSYSYVSKDFFPRNSGQAADIALNAPRHKFALSAEYRNDDLGFGAQVRLRFVDGFPFSSGVFVGDVHSYRELDLAAGYNLPFSRNTRFTLTITNLMNERHQEMIGVPEIGRLTLARLTQTF